MMCTTFNGKIGILNYKDQVWHCSTHEGRELELVHHAHSLLSSATLEEEEIVLAALSSPLCPPLPKLKIIELTEYRLNGLSAKRVGRTDRPTEEEGEENREVCTFLYTQSKTFMQNVLHYAGR